MNSVREKKFMTRSLYVLLFGLESELRLTGTGFDEKKKCIRIRLEEITAINNIAYCIIVLNNPFC